MDRSQKKKDKSISIRFIANDETLEDVSEKLSAAVVNDEENNWTKEFLQAGSTIFGSSGRKRSGSMDSSASSTSEPNQSIGTWKLIKGKVVQAVEDIKKDKEMKKELSLAATSDAEIDDFADIMANKTDMGLDTPTGGIDSGDDTDSETTSLTKLIDKFQQKRSKRCSTPDKKSSIISRLGRNIGNDDNGEKGTPAEKKLSSSPSSSLLSKFGSRKSKTLDKGDEDGESTILAAFLKSRKKDTTVDKTPPPKKRNVEVEDGVEIFEDMTISAIAEDATAIDKPPVLQLDLKPASLPIKTVDINKPVPAVTAPSSVSSMKHMVLDNQLRLSAVVIGLFSILFFEVPPFLLGFLTCLVLMYCGHKVYNWAVESCSPEVGQAQIVEKIGISPVCELPPVIEHKSLKSYAGWMYETLNYDPNNMSLLRNAVFVKLDGSLLRISTASSRIKRSMLYKDAIDTSTVDFIQHKFYNLEMALVEMSPKGLARKRYFSRKYPILLVIPRISCEPRRWADSKQNSEDDSMSTPTKGGDDRRFDRIYLFAIRDREKEDWFRRFIDASVGNNCDSEFPTEFLTLLGRKRGSPEPSVDMEPDAKGYLETEFPKMDDKGKEEEEHDFTVLDKAALNETADSFHIRASASRLSVDFLNYIGSYQHANMKYLASACSNASSPTSTTSTPSHFQFYRTLDGRADATPSSVPASPSRNYSFLKTLQLSRTRGDKKVDTEEVTASPEKNEEVEAHELVQGFSITINVGWANILLGRVVYGCVHDAKIIENIREFMQKKLSVLKLPSFMEEVNVAEIQLGNKPPIIQSISSPELDERGLWLDLDLTYDGLVEVTITTNLNLMRLKRQQMPNDSASSQNLVTPQPTNTSSSPSASPSNNHRSSAVLYDSDAESSGSSSESESSLINNQLYMSYDVASASPANPEGTVLLNRVVTDDKSTGGGGSKRFLRIVDRIAASNIFQSATELSYVQNAFKNMSTKIQLKLQLKSLMGRLVVNVPPTPSDRVWVAFRAPPKIELSAKPTLGSNVVDWTLITNLIENKLYEEVCKYLVFPNMVDIIMPVLGESTYKE